MARPTTQELTDRNLTNLEGNLAQTSPLNDKAFLRVLATVQALSGAGLYAYADERTRQNLVLTAAGTDLDRLGINEGVYRKPAEASVLLVSIAATDGLTVDTIRTFTGDANGMRYTTAGSTVASDGFTTATLIADTVGVAGNLQDTDTLTIVSQQVGIGAVAIVTETVNTGAEEERNEPYRQRILFAMRSTRGGGNATDHKSWAEEVAGVYRAFPYAGKPLSLGGTSYPADRCVFIECETTVNADGIPPIGLLTEIRDSLTIDPETGKGRMALGLTNDTLWVEPITRTAVNITITNLTDPTIKDGIEAALDSYLRLLAPYIEGVDLPQYRNDRVTTPALADIVQGIMSAVGASADSVVFTVAGGPYNSYQLSQGQLVKLGTVTYAIV